MLRPVVVLVALLLAHGVAAPALAQGPSPGGISAPVEIPKFKLKTLDGKQVTLESLKGKIVVINFWGIWCVQCLKEMPEIQKLHEKYANDPAVTVITINTDEKPSDVPPWMKERGYTFPVLIDNGYINKADLQVFPTTWFLDAEGQKVSEKVGYTEKLFEEFSARVEAIRSGSPIVSRR